MQNNKFPSGKMGACEQELSMSKLCLASSVCMGLKYKTKIKCA